MATYGSIRYTGIVDAGVSGGSSGATSTHNKIINGDFDIWQRGTSQTTLGYGSADRWKNSHIGSTKTSSQQEFTLGQTDVLNNPKYFLRHEVTSVSGSSNYVVMQQYVENVTTLSGQTATLSFWAKADSAKNIAVEFVQSFGTGGTPSTVVTEIGSQLIALTTSWTKYTVTVSIPSVSGKTLGTDGNDYLGLVFWFDAGSDFSARSASLGQQSGTFDIAQVQLEEGAIANPFQNRTYGEELQLCQRYYQYCGGSHATSPVAFIWLGSTTTARITYNLSTPLRATPSWVILPPHPVILYYDNGRNQTITSVNAITCRPGSNTVGMEDTVTSGSGAGGKGVMVTATSCYFDAEL